MTDVDEDTDPSAPIPLWIEKAVLKGLKAQDVLWAERERRILSALDKLGVARLELAQKATESGLHLLRLDFDDLHRRIVALESHPKTMPCAPPSESVGGE